MSIPHMGHGAAPFIDIARKMFTEKGLFFYQVYFQDEGVAEAELEADVRDSIRRLYYRVVGRQRESRLAGRQEAWRGRAVGLENPKKFPAWLPDEDIDYLVKEFTGSGFRGPLNRYRNFHRDFALVVEIRRQEDRTAGPVHGRCSRRRHPHVRPGVEERMRGNFADLRGFHLIEGAGHWNQQEKPEETNRLLLGWLKGL